MTNSDQDAIDAVDTLNDLIGDLAAGTLVLRDYCQQYKTGAFNLNQMSAVQKMCLSHLVLAFVKLLEFWKRYHQLVPDKHRADLKALNDTLKRKGVRDFRNKVAGHIWDSKQGRPLRHSEIMASLEVLTDGHLDQFLRWVNNPDGNTYPQTVLSVIEALRDSLVDEHGIQVPEVIDR